MVEDNVEIKNSQFIISILHEVHDIADGRYDGRIQKYQQGLSK